MEHFIGFQYTYNKDGSQKISETEIINTEETAERRQKNLNEDPII